MLFAHQALMKVSHADRYIESLFGFFLPWGRAVTIQVIKKSTVKFVNLPMRAIFLNDQPKTAWHNQTAQHNTHCHSQPGTGSELFCNWRFAAQTRDFRAF